MSAPPTVHYISDDSDTDETCEDDDMPPLVSDADIGSGKSIVAGLYKELSNMLKIKG